MQDPQIAEKQRQHCVVEVIEGCVEAGAVLMDVAMAKDSTPRASLENLQQVRKNIERAERALSALVAHEITRNAA